MQSSKKIDRARQFLPFDALKGFKEALREKEKNIENKKYLFDDSKERINKNLLNTKKGDLVRIKYYSSLEYIETIGSIKMIDFVYKKIKILNTEILFDDIVDIITIN